MKGLALYHLFKSVSTQVYGWSQHDVIGRCRTVSRAKLPARLVYCSFVLCGFRAYLVLGVGRCCVCWGTRV